MPGRRASGTRATSRHASVSPSSTDYAAVDDAAVDTRFVPIERRRNVNALLPSLTAYQGFQTALVRR
jgi:hypothetical protein